MKGPWHQGIRGQRVKAFTSGFEKDVGTFNVVEDSKSMFVCIIVSKILYLILWDYCRISSGSRSKPKTIESSLIGKELDRKGIKGLYFSQLYIDLI